MCNWKTISMNLKALLARTRNVSGLYGEDLVIVKPDCHTPKQYSMAGHRSESLDQ